MEDETKGGVVIFCGEVRSITGEDKTESLVYESYVEMAVAQMGQIAEAASQKWGANIAVAHRLGELRPKEIAVVCVAACAHRVEAFDCCRFLIDEIKKDVPIWKAEA